MKTTALYTEVYNKILEEIKNGEYPENLPLPAERYLCMKYHVSRSTIRAALNLLNKEGVVYTIHGAGTFIQPSFITQPLKNLYSFTDTLKKMNIQVQNDIVSYNLVIADQFLINKTKCSEGTLFHKIVRLRSTKDCPLMIETSYLPQSCFESIDLQNLEEGSILEVLKRDYGFIPRNASETFRAIIPLQHEKELLQIYTNIPCMLVERVTCDVNNIGIYTKFIIRGDKYIFSVDFS